MRSRATLVESRTGWLDRAAENSWPPLPRLSPDSEPDPEPDPLPARADEDEEGWSVLPPYIELVAITDEREARLAQFFRLVRQGGQGKARTSE